MEANSVKKILVATDYTGLSDNAIRTASALCRKQNAILVLLHVVEGAVPYDEHHFDIDYSTELKKFARTQLEEVAGNIRERNKIPVEEIVAYGDVVKEIVHAAKENDARLLLIGTHGASGFRRFFIGSTSYRVIRHATCPVMTIPGEGDWTGFRDILVPVKPGAPVLENYERVREFILAHGSNIHIFGLVADPGSDKMPEVLALGHKLAERLGKDRIAYDISYDHCHHYADKILEAAGRKKADLIVITESLDITFKDLFIGPVAQQVINHSKVPVLFTRMS